MKRPPILSPTERLTDIICAVLWFVALGFAVFGGVK